MKRTILSLFIVLCIIVTAKAQVLPSFQFGIKGGVNLAGISSSASNSFSTNNQAGYLGGLWARFGALGFNFQPELYYTSKNVDITANGGRTKATFNSVDVPLLFGGKIGALGIGGRFYTGPVASFNINKTQSLSGINPASLDNKGENFAWQFGAGVDVKSVSFDLRYEAGITRQAYGLVNTRINLFSLAVAFRLAKI